MSSPRVHTTGDFEWGQKIAGKEYAVQDRLSVLRKAPTLAEINTIQGYDSTAFYSLLKHAEYATEDNVPCLSAETMADLVTFGHILPARAIVTNHVHSPQAPTTMEQFFALAQAAYGHIGHVNARRFHPVNKNTPLNNANNAYVNKNINELAHHSLYPGSDDQLLDLQHISADFIPENVSWIPSYVAQGNLLAPPSNTKSSWFSVADSGTYSKLKFDNHGLGTFFTPLVGNVLLVFNNQVDDPVLRIDIMRWEQNGREDISIRELEDIYRKHMRYVVLTPGELWYMKHEPGTIYAMHRLKGSILFGGHFIPEQKLNLRIHTATESLRHPYFTNEQPDSILRYVEAILGALDTHRLSGDWKRYGGKDAVHSILQLVMEILIEGVVWFIERPELTQNVHNDLRNRWNFESERIALRYAGLLQSAKSDL